jgi:hypothetical protein
MVMLALCTVYIYVNDYVDIRQPYSCGQLKLLHFSRQTKGNI